MEIKSAFFQANDCTESERHLHGEIIYVQHHLIKYSGKEPLFTEQF
jgi:hypothetical protein